MSKRSAILTYHSLDESGSVISIRPDQFGRQMEALAKRARVVPLAGIPANPGSVAITFDDGFGSFAEHAVPVLERLSLPATVFVVSGYCGGRNNWPTQSSGIPPMPLMGWSELRALPPSISIGAHTVTHPDLTALSDSQVLAELRQSREEIEQNTGRAVTTFAYPYGALDARTRAMARREFALACGTRLAFTETGADVADLPRLDTYYLGSDQWFGHLFDFSTVTYVALRRFARELRRRRPAQMR